jgi:acyl carrier protein
MSIQWGGFAEIGLAAAHDILGKRLSSRGMASFSPAEGLEALQRLLDHPRPVVGIVRFDARQWVEFYPNTASVPFFSEVIKQDFARDKSRPRAKQMLVHLRAALPADRVPLLERHVMEQLGTVLRLDPRRIDRMSPFQNLGIDSLMSLELRNRLEASLGIRLSATVLFTYATTAALVEHLCGLLLASDDADAEPMRNAPQGSTQEKHQQALEVDRRDIELEVNKLSGDALLDELARELSDN